MQWYGSIICATVFDIEPYVHHFMNVNRILCHCAVFITTFYKLWLWCWLHICHNSICEMHYLRIHKDIWTIMHLLCTYKLLQQILFLETNFYNEQHLFLNFAYYNNSVCNTSIQRCCSRGLIKRSCIRNYLNKNLKEDRQYCSHQETAYASSIWWKKKLERLYTKPYKLY